MRVPVNLASRPADHTRPLRNLAIVLGAVLLILAGVVVRSELRARRDFRSLVDRTNQLEAEIREMAGTQREMQNWLATPQVVQIRKRSALLNSLIGQKSLSWTRMFQDLEATLPAGARILSITPQAQGAKGLSTPELKLAVSASTVVPLVEFIRRLEDSPVFENPVVDGQQYPAETDEEGEIRMALSTRYIQAPLPRVEPGAKELAENVDETDQRSETRRPADGGAVIAGGQKAAPEALARTAEVRR